MQSDQAKAVFGPLLNATTNKLMASDPNLPKDVSRASLVLPAQIAPPCHPSEIGPGESGYLYPKNHCLSSFLVTFY